MATEKRLIDANAIKYTEYRSGGGRDYPENIVTEYEIDRMPTVDAVEVVRCKDCKHFVQNEPYDPCECMHWTVKFGVAYTKPDDFCSYGERIV